MEIKSKITDRAGDVFDVVYREDDPLKDLDGKVLHGVHGFCFYGDKMVLVYNEAKGSWSPPGGGIEAGETPDTALAREILEETNMKVLNRQLIGYQDIYEPDRIVRQVRTFCVVEPFGDFVSDPDGDITAITLIDPSEYKQYFDWNEIGGRIMKRANEMYSLYKK